MRQPTSWSPARRVILASAATVMSACGVDSSTSPRSPYTALSDAALATAPSAGVAVERPWKGRCDIEARFTGPTTVLITGTCQLAHLGRATVVTEETISRETGTLLTTTTYTAANGDLLYVTGRANLTPNGDGSATIIGTWTAVGGTGRFAGASGTAAYAETARPDPERGVAIGSYTLDGRLTY
jgi:hypothetical protein